MSQPLPSIGEKFEDLDIIAKLLSIEEKDIDDKLPIISMSAGVAFLYIPLNSVNAMKKIQLRQDIWEKYFKATDDAKHIFTFTTNTGDLPVDIYSRMFAPSMGRPSSITIKVSKIDQETISISIAGTSVIMVKDKLFL